MPVIDTMVPTRQPRGGLPVLAVALIAAATAWFFLFAVPGVPFWKVISGATLLLGVFGANWAYPDTLAAPVQRWGVYLLLGVLAAAVLYAVFALGHRVALLFPFGAAQVEGVYATRAQASPGVIGALLLFPIGPGEELFWRAWVQRALMQRFGPWRGFTVTLLLYTAIHLPSLNLTLIAAAAVAGAFWGLLYMVVGHVGPGVISHALWDAAAFVWFPFGG